MTNQGENNIRLGLFVLTGLFVLILGFYLIGKNRNIFGSGFEVRARFKNLNGLTEGSNVLYAGIQAGTVSKINILNDTTLEATLTIDNKFKAYIHQNAMAAIGTEGLMGDKLVSLTPVKGNGRLVKDGDLLTTEQIISTDELLQTLSKTNNNIAVVSEALKTTVLKINQSRVWDLLNDNSIGSSVKASLNNILKTTANARSMSRNLDQLISATRQGKGPAGILLADTAFARDLKTAMTNIKHVSDQADQLTGQLNSVAYDANHSNGLLKLLNDSTAAHDLRKSLENVQKGTDGFNQNMEALKHNFLLRGYFRKLEKKQQAKP